MKSICLLSHNLGGNGRSIAHLLGCLPRKRITARANPGIHSRYLFSGILLVLVQTAFMSVDKITGILEIIRARFAGF